MDPRDGRPIDPRDPRDMRGFDPKDPRSMAQQPLRDPRDMPRDIRDERMIAPPRDSPRSYVLNSAFGGPGPDVRGGPEINRPPPGLTPFGAFGASAEEMRERERLLQRERAAEDMREREMRERERLLQREREAEMEVQSRLAREGGGGPPFGRR